MYFLHLIATFQWSLRDYSHSIDSRTYIETLRNNILVSCYVWATSLWDFRHIRIFHLPLRFTWLGLWEVSYTWFSFRPLDFFLCVLSELSLEIQWKYSVILPLLAQFFHPTFVSGLFHINNSYMIETRWQLTLVSFLQRTGYKLP